MAPDAARITGRKKAAILLVALGKEGAAEVFKHLSNDMIQQLTVEMGKNCAVEPATSEYVLEEFIESTTARGYMAEGGLGYAREVLERALGSQRAGDPSPPLRGDRDQPVRLPALDAARRDRRLPAQRAPADHRAGRRAAVDDGALGAKVMELLARCSCRPTSRLHRADGPRRTPRTVARKVAVAMEHKPEMVPPTAQVRGRGGVRPLASHPQLLEPGDERKLLDHCRRRNAAHLAKEAPRAAVRVQGHLEARRLGAIETGFPQADVRIWRRHVPDAAGGRRRSVQQRRAAAPRRRREEMNNMLLQSPRVVEEARRDRRHCSQAGGRRRDRDRPRRRRRGR